EVTVVRISDADPAMLRYFSDIGLTPDTQLTIQKQRPYTDATTITLPGQHENIDLGPTAANAIWVTTS
ncbi:Fe2+ transport system protein FeoA, partial [Arthrobacter sp. CAN_A214]|uniref:FeoA family protein n=1 Tax=Arthrobacter sp. CAN_A214 TaxID=2787720 RepID=UPI0018CA81D4